MTKKSDRITANLDTLTDDDLKFVAQLVGVILQARADKRAKENDPKEQEEQVKTCSTGLSKQPTGGGWYEKKMIRGCGPYVYYRWREGKKLRTKYIGKAR
jgi:hypothetical protein